MAYDGIESNEQISATAGESVVMIALLIVGSIVGLIGWVMLVVAAFRTNAFWGLAVLIGPIAVYFVVPGNLWVGEIVGLAIVLAFAVPRWSEVKTALILYVIGSVMSLPAFIPELSGWQHQGAFNEDCRNRPARTVCAKYEDGYVWLVDGAISGWEKKFTGVNMTQVAIASDGRYEHILGTDYVRVVRTKEQETAYAERQQRRGSQPDTPYVPPPAPVMAAAVPTTAQPADPPSDAASRLGIQMAPVERVYVVNATKKYYPLDCKARPENAYKMAKSLATNQGYTLASECGKSGR